jgi:hypothetical protein
MFLGHAAEERADSFRAVGTGFFVNHERFRFLVTAQHIAAEFGDSPFYIRVNKNDGSAATMHCDLLERDDLRWIAHADPNVDLAVMPFQFSAEEQGWDVLGFDSGMLLGDEDLVAYNIGVGDRCYAVGLFRLLQGSERNVPIVHSGSLALMAGEEPIPVKDWLAAGQTRQVEAHLVEMSNLKGLSGAPVFVYPTLWAIAPKAGFDENDKPKILPPTLVGAYDPRVKLLGLWSASWDGLQSAVETAGFGANRVPIGMGTVVPAARLKELFDDPRVLERRADWLRRADEHDAARKQEAAAQPD